MLSAFTLCCCALLLLLYFALCSCLLFCIPLSFFCISSVF